MDVGDLGDDFRAYREYKREKKQKQLENLSLWYERLRKSGLHIEELSDEHIRLSRHGNDVADWWPSTGRWILKGNRKRGFGIRRLLEATAEQVHA